MKIIKSYDRQTRWYFQVLVENNFIVVTKINLGEYLLKNHYSNLFLVHKKVL